jgi:NRPS condensation-like uncharacterized protein
MNDAASSASRVSSTAYESVDALAGAFAALARHDNTNTNQIVTVLGDIDADLLAAAFTRAVRMFPLLLAGFPPRQNPAALEHGGHEIPSVHEWDGACDVEDPAFRALLMTLNERNRIDWKRGRPCQLYLIRARDRRTSCVYLSSAHAVADARSDCLLLDRIMREYVARPQREDVELSGRAYGFSSLQKILPHWYGAGARLRRYARAFVSITRDFLRFDLRLPRNRDASVPDTRLDFYRSVFDETTAGLIARAAKKAGVTINTVFVAVLVRLLETKNGNRRSGMIRLTCAISLRFTLEAQYMDTFRNYLVAVGMRFPAGLSTKDLLTRVQDDVRVARQPARLQLELGRLEWLELLLSVPVLYPLARFIVRRTQGTNVCFSNPGVISEDFSYFGSDKEPPEARLPVSQYVGFGCLVEPYDFILYTPTVNGRLQLDAVYRRAAFTDFAAEFIEPYREQLIRLLGELGESDGAAANPMHTDDPQRSPVTQESAESAYP